MDMQISEQVVPELSRTLEILATNLLEGIFEIKKGVHSMNEHKIYSLNDRALASLEKRKQKKR